MKAKLLKVLRKEIINNTTVHWYAYWSGYLSTTLHGKTYDSKDHNSEELGDPNIAAKELEHIALEGFLRSKKYGL